MSLHCPPFKQIADFAKPDIKRPEMATKWKVNEREYNQWVRLLKRHGYSGPFAGLTTRHECVKFLAKELKKRTIPETRPRDPRTIASNLTRYERGKQRRKLSEVELGAQPPPIEGKEGLRVLAMQWCKQLSCPPPQLVLIDSLGRTGEDNSMALRQDILNIALEDLRFNVRVTQTTLHPSYAHTIGRIFWELPLDGSVKLLCPVERQPRFQELLASLSVDDRQNFDSWKSLGGRFLVVCMRARRTIHDEAKTRAGGLVTVDSIFDKIRSDLTLPPGPRLPSHLNVEFGDLIYSLSIKCRRSPSILPLIEGLYYVRQTGLFCDLVFGQYAEPLAKGLRPEIEHWIDLHQSMIKEFTQSEVISQLMELHKRILSLEAKLKMALDKIIAEKP
jgi:hypothetical protein